MNRATFIARSAIIAAIYAIVTYALKPISYGPIQVRFSEALVLLPLIEDSAVPGLFLGCVLANIIGGLGIWDVCFGSLITLVAAFLTSKMPGPLLGAVWPVFLNALGVSYYLSFLYKAPYEITALYIGIGELIAVVGVGIPLYYVIKRTSLMKIFKKNK